MTDAEKLAAYETMRAKVQADYETAAAKMAQLKAQGKEKTATYRQLFAAKLTASNILALYRLYGLEGENARAPEH